ncbi:MAG: 4Fe-4S dicluster domain-containing protein [Desulfovibrionaceae bacterium]
MSGKSFLIDMTKCTACRGCQIACKQWKKLPATETEQTGTHQNPPDLSASTLKLVRFSESVDEDGRMNWLFFPEQCRHCVEPPCIEMGTVQGSMIHDEATGAVIYTKKTAKESIDDVRGVCPYDIPRQDPKSKVIVKCDMCIDRVQNGLLPACVQICPTGCMNFGDREDMLALAEERLAEAKKKWPKATLVNPEDVRVIYLTATEPKKYYDFLAAAPGVTGPMSRRSLLASLARPLRRMRG